MDPITISALISAGAQIGGQIASNIGSKKREAEYKAKAELEDKKFQIAKDRIAGIDFSPGSGIYELEQQRKMQAELLGSEADRRGDEREARAIAALGDSPRDMYAIAPRLIQESEKMQQAADLQSGQMKVEAVAGTTAAEQKAEDQARARDMMLAQLDLDRAGKSFDTYTQGAYGERAARVEGNRALMSELAETGIAVGGNLAQVKASENALAAAQAARDAEELKFRNMFGQPETTATATDDVLTDPIAEYGPFIPDDAVLVPDQSERPGTYDFSGPYVGDDGYNLDFGQPEEGTFSPDDTVLPEDEPTFDPYDVIYGLQHGGFIGKDGGLTEGEYSHETNKKAIVDEENGRKEGEMTGGEFVLPEYFVKDIEELRAQAEKAREAGDEKKVQEIEAEIGRQYLKFTSAPRFQEA